MVSQATINAPRRLLQFAVRDAVATSRPSDLTAEHSLKRLRSVVSTSMEDSNIEERAPRVRLVARAPNAMQAAIRAVAEAAKDVTKIRPSRNVFDRLGRPTDASDTLNQLPEFGDTVADDDEGETYGDTGEQTMSPYDLRNEFARAYTRNMSVLQSDTRMTIDPPHDEDDDMRMFRRGVVGASQTGTSGGYRAENSLTVHSRLGKNAEELVHESGKNHDPSGAVSNTSHMLVNTTGSLNTWRSPQHQEATDSFVVDNRKLLQVTSAVTPKSSVQLMKENDIPVASTNGNVRLILLSIFLFIAWNLCHIYEPCSCYTVFAYH